MTLLDAVNTIYRRRFLVLLMVILFGLIGIVINYVVLAPTYEATAKVKIERFDNSPADMSKMVRILNSQRVTDRIISLIKDKSKKRRDNAESNRPYFWENMKEAEELQSYVKQASENLIVTTDVDSGIIEISFRSNRPSRSEQIVNVFVEAFALEIDPEQESQSTTIDGFTKEAGEIKGELIGLLEASAPESDDFARLSKELEMLEQILLLYENNKENTRTQPADRIKVASIQQAEKPMEPISPQRERNVAIALLIGIVVGVLMAFRIERSESQA